jgi:hypothetical protein
VNDKEVLKKLFEDRGVPFEDTSYEDSVNCLNVLPDKPICLDRLACNGCADCKIRKGKKKECAVEPLSYVIRLQFNAAGDLVNIDTLHEN